MKIRARSLGLTLAVILASSCMVSSNPTKAQIGGRLLSVPHSYIVSYRAGDTGEGEYDPVSMLVVKFEWSEVITGARAESSTYPKGEFRVIISEPSAEALRLINSYEAHLDVLESFAEAQARGASEPREALAGLVKVHLPAENPRYWAFVKPNAIHERRLAFDDVVARCRVMGQGPEYVCRRSVYRDGVTVEYSLEGENIGLYAQVDEYIFRKLAEWTAD